MQNDFPKELPSAADLDVVAAEQKAREATSGQRDLLDEERLSVQFIDLQAGPTPKQTDWIIASYQNARTAKTEADDDEKNAKKTLLALIRFFGHPAAGSEHSHIIKGSLHSAMMTGVTSTSFDENRVQALANFLVEKDLFRELFPRLFSARIKHELVAGAEQVLLTADMPENVRKKLKALFAECIKVTDSAPRVKVELLAKEPKQPRKRAAKKQAQKQAVQA